MQGAIVAIENPESNVFGFQFHPEVMHTDGGMDMLKHFLVGIAGVKADWTMDHVLEGQLRLIADTVSLVLTWLLQCVMHGKKQGT